MRPVARVDGDLDGAPFQRWLGDFRGRCARWLGRRSWLRIDQAPIGGGIASGASNESITFRNGSRIVFAARERGAVRGFTKVDIIILDEAQILTDGALSDMAPTQNQADNPLIILMGTPPRPQDPGEVFSRLRAEALRASRTTCSMWSSRRLRTPILMTQRRLLRRTRRIRSGPSRRRFVGCEAAECRDYMREVLGIWDDDVQDSATG